MFSNPFRLRSSTQQQPMNWKLNLHSIERFREILQCERMRSDRSGSRFCTVVFTLETSEEAICQRFIKHLRSRLRATDHIGLLSANQVAVILWDTSEPGARLYVHAIDEDKSTTCVKNTTIYVYPLNNTPESPNEKNTNTEIEPGPAGNLEPASVEPLEVLFIQQLPLWKRTIDILGASVGLILLAPLLAFTALLIKLTSKGPVLFTQQRDGLGGKPFVIYKFRTMQIDAEERKEELRKFSEQDGPAFKLTNDPRITGIGKFLRKSCIDELPQLWNVILGDMTLVGPRPLPCNEADKIEGWGRRRLEITPGLTCIWQVHGKSRVTFSEWMRMDIRYIKQRNLLQDIKLLWETFVSVIRHKASV